MSDKFTVRTRLGRDEIWYHSGQMLIALPDGERVAALHDFDPVVVLDVGDGWRACAIERGRNFKPIMVIGPKFPKEGPGFGDGPVDAGGVGPASSRPAPSASDVASYRGSLVELIENVLYWCDSENPDGSRFFDFSKRDVAGVIVGTLERHKALPYIVGDLRGGDDG